MKTDSVKKGRMPRTRVKRKAGDSMKIDSIKNGCTRVRPNNCLVERKAGGSMKIDSIKNGYVLEHARITASLKERREAL